MIPATKPIPTAKREGSGCIQIRAIATKNGESKPVLLTVGFFRRTDDSVRPGTTVWPDSQQSKDCPSGRTWGEFYPILGHHFGGDIEDYLKEGVAFETLDGCPIFDNNGKHAPRRKKPS